MKLPYRELALINPLKHQRNIRFDEDFHRSVKFESPLHLVLSGRFYHQND